MDKFVRNIINKETAGDPNLVSAGMIATYYSSKNALYIFKSYLYGMIQFGELTKSLAMNCTTCFKIIK